MAKNVSLYFIAIIPPDPIRKQITDIKTEFSKNYHTYKSLNSPPHITLVPPTYIDIKDIKKIICDLSDFAKSVDPFSIEINGYGSFKPNVIFLNIAKNEAIFSLRHRLETACQWLAKPEEKTVKRFSPHITLAFRDLSGPMFQQAWELYKYQLFYQVFLVQSIFVLKHNGKCWEIINELLFTG